MNVNINSSTMNHSTGFEWWSKKDDTQPDDAAKLLRIDAKPKSPANGPVVHREKKGCGKSFDGGVCGTILFYKKGWPEILCPKCIEARAKKLAELEAEREALAKQEMDERIRAYEKLKELQAIKAQADRDDKQIRKSKALEAAEARSRAKEEARAEKERAREAKMRKIAVKVAGQEYYFPSMKEAAAKIGVHVQTIREWMNGRGSAGWTVRKTADPVRSEKYMGRGIFIMTEDGKETWYKSINAAARTYGVDQASVAGWAKQGGNAKRNLRVRYDGEDYQPYTPKVRMVKPAQAIRSFHEGMVEVYESIRIAGEKTGLGKDLVYRLLRSGKQSKDGWKFERVEQ